MNAFVYNNPTKVVFQEDGESRLAELLTEQNCKKIMIVYGGNSALKSGLITRVIKIIEDISLEYVTINGIIPNPLLSKVEEGIKLGKSNHVDLILAIGGGSVIDTAKAIGVGIYNKGDIWDFFEGKREIESSIPIATILTIPAAGSEMSTSCVITKDDGMLKRSFNHQSVICKFAILDPKLTLTLPAYQTASGAVDIMMHTMERYFNTVTNLELTDALAQSLVKTVMKYAKVLKDEPNNIEARWNIMWAGSLSHNGLMNCGNNRGDWATHIIEHEIAGLFDVAHGAGLAAIWASWARYVVDIIPHRFAKFGINVLGLDDNCEEMTLAIECIDKIEAFFKDINMPTTLEELGIKPTKEEMELMALKATNFNYRTVGTVKPLVQEDIINILNNSNK